MRKFLLLVFFLSLLISCTIDKRHYRPGFYLDHRESSLPGKRAEPKPLLLNQPVTIHLVSMPEPQAEPVVADALPDRPVKQGGVQEKDPGKIISGQDTARGSKMKEHVIIHHSAENISKTSALLSLLMLVGLFIQSPVAFLFLALAVIFAALAVIAGLNARNKAIAEGQSVPKDAKTGIRTGLLVLFSIIAGALALLIVLWWTIRNGSVEFGPIW